MLNGGSMVWGFCVYFVYMIPLETDVLRKHRFQKYVVLENTCDVLSPSAVLNKKCICDF